MYVKCNNHIHRVVGTKIVYCLIIFTMRTSFRFSYNTRYDEIMMMIMVIKNQILANEVNDYQINQQSTNIGKTGLLKV